MFQDMIWRIKEDVVRFLYFLQPAPAEETIIQRRPRIMRESRGEEMQKKQTVVRKDKKVGRNEPCPCGSGKKYKKCCGA
jgi:preprotein translocase subunit SecA